MGTIKRHPAPEAVDDVEKATSKTYRDKVQMETLNKVKFLQRG